MHQYEKMKREGKTGMTDGPVTDAVAIARNSEFIMDSNVNNAKKCGAEVQSSRLVGSSDSPSATTTACSRSTPLLT